MLNFSNFYVKGAIVLVALISVGAAKYFWSNSPQTVLVEEIAEEVIKDETGLDINMVPTNTVVKK